MKRYEELVQEAIEMLNNDDDLFIECVNELDSWNGYANDYRAWDMCCIDDFYCDCKATKLLSDLTSDFNVDDDFFYYSIWGLESTNDVAELYRDNTTSEDVYDAVIDKYNHIDIEWINAEFDELINSIVNWSEEEGEEVEEVA